MSKITSDLVKAAAQNTADLKGVEADLKSPETFAKSMLRVGPIDVDNYDLQYSQLWTNLIWRISRDVIKHTNFNSALYQFVEQLPVGADTQETFLHLKEALDRKALSNSNLFTDYIDKIDVAYHRVSDKKTWITTYADDEIRKITSNWETLTKRISEIIANLENSFQYWFHNRVKQMVYDGWSTGQIRTFKTNADYRTPDGAKEFIGDLNTLMDEMRIEPSEDFSGGNLNSKITTPIITVSNDLYVITKAEILRKTEILSAIELYFGGQFGGDNNKDYLRKFIKIKDFPTTVVDNSYPAGYSGSPEIAGTPLALVFDRDFFIMASQFKIMLDFLNIVTLKHQQALHADLLMSFSPFSQAVMVVE